MTHRPTYRYSAKQTSIDSPAYILQLFCSGGCLGLHDAFQGGNARVTELRRPTWHGPGCRRAVAHCVRVIEPWRSILKYYVSPAEGICIVMVTRIDLIVSEIVALPFVLLSQAFPQSTYNSSGRLGKLVGLIVCCQGRLRMAGRL